VLLHELHERNLMAAGWPYSRATRISSRVGITAGTTPTNCTTPWRRKAGRKVERPHPAAGGLRGTAMVKVAPRPGWDSIRSRPPSPSTRSRMLNKPNPPNSPAP